MVLKPTFLDIAQQFWLNAVVALGISDFLANIYRMESKLNGRTTYIIVKIN